LPAAAPALDRPLARSNAPPPSHSRADEAEGDVAAAWWMVAVCPAREMNASTEGRVGMEDLGRTQSFLGGWWLSERREPAPGRMWRATAAGRGRATGRG
jgi:hypothetical protein